MAHRPGHAGQFSRWGRSHPHRCATRSEITHRQPRRSAGTWSAGQFSRWGPPTGIARERETSADDADPSTERMAHRPGNAGQFSRWGRSHPHRCATRSEITHRRPRRSAGTAWSAGLRPASRGSAKPAPITPSPRQSGWRTGPGTPASSPGGGVHTRTAARRAARSRIAVGDA